MTNLLRLQNEKYLKYLHQVELFSPVKESGENIQYIIHRLGQSLVPTQIPIDTSFK